MTSSKPFASSADLAAKEATLEELADGVYAYTAQGDPNVGCVIGTDAILAIEARATPVMAQRWIDVVRTLSPLPFGDLVLTHYHAVRVLGASAFGARRIVATRMTADLIEERGEQDWASEQGRMPRLFEGAESIPGLTRPTETFEERMEIDGREVILRPIRPEDAAAYARFFASVEPRDLGHRFFGAARTLTPATLARASQIDYDREMSLMVSTPPGADAQEILAEVRLVTEPENQYAEVAILVRGDANRSKAG